MSENKNSIQIPLGWGIIGTAAGYQYSVQGIESQLNCVRSWDLAQNIAVALPEPDSKELLPLYRLSIRNIQLGGQVQTVVALIQYLSIKQRGSYRNGTFFGSFIESVNSGFSSQAASELIKGLTELSSFQYIHFIDKEQASYKQDINSVAFQSPMNEMSSVAKKLLNDFRPKAGSRTLFIDCRQSTTHCENELVRLLEFPDLLQCYGDIYFSASETICERMKKVADIEMQHIDGFKSSYIAMLRSGLNVQIQKYEQVAGEYNHYKANVEQEKKAFQESVTQTYQQQEQKLMTAHQQILLDKEQNIERLNQDIASLQGELSNYQGKSALFDEIVNFIRKNTDIAGEQQIMIERLESENQILKRNLEDKQQQLAVSNQQKGKLESGLKNQQMASQEIERIQDDLKLFKLASIGFSVLSLCLIIGLGVMWWFSSGKSDEIKTLTEEVSSMKEQLNTKTLSFDELQKQFNNLQRQQNSEPLIEPHILEKEPKNNRTNTR